MRKRIQRAQNKDDLHNLGSDDILSRLPDEILVSILSCLPLKDAVVTSSLSRRWVYLWCQTDSLVFEDKERWSLICTGLEERNKYMSWVNDIIHQHKSPNVNDLKICFGLDTNAKGAITKWIKFAISKNVQTLELDLSRNYGYKRNYCFPTKIFDRKRGLSLKRQSSSVLGMEIKFLKVLILKGVNVNDEGLKKILSNCPVLEHLSILGSCKLVKVEIHGKGLALKNLDMRLCYGIKSVEICDSNIVSFSCLGSPISLRLGNLQKLEKICISESFLWERINDMFCRLSCIPYLHVLRLNLYCLKVSIGLLPFPKLQKLEQLFIRVIDRGDNVLLVCDSLVEACPNLQRFIIEKMCWFDEGKTMEVRQMAKKPHQSLEVIEIGEYHGGTSDLELVMYFIQNCVALKRLVIKPTKEEEENGGRYNARQRLEAILPDGVELVIHSSAFQFQCTTT